MAIQGYTEGHNSHSRLCLKYIIYHTNMIHYKAERFVQCAVNNHPERTHTRSVLNNTVDRASLF